MFIYTSTLLFLMIQAAVLVGKLGSPHKVLNKRPGNSNVLPLLFVGHLPTHSLSNRLNEMRSGALCRGKKNENNGHSGKIKLYGAFQKAALFSLLSLCSHNGLIFVPHWNTPIARKTSHPAPQQMYALKVINKEGVGLGGWWTRCLLRQFPARHKIIDRWLWMAGRDLLEN